MKKIQLKNSNKFFVIDDVDHEAICNFNWGISPDGYVRGTVNGTRVFVHRFLLNAKKGEIIDHIDGDPLNNTKKNLRVCKHNQNSANSFKKPGLSIYKGVSYDTNMKRKKRWMARLEHKGKNITIGRYYTEEEAAIAYNEVAYKIWGNFCILNDVLNKKQKRCSCIK